VTDSAPYDRAAYAGRVTRQTDQALGSATTTGRDRSRLQVAAVVSVVVHLAAIYWPRVDVVGPVPWTDKVVHVLLFGVPTVLLLVARPTRLHPALVVGLLALHAPLSELLQHYALPHRSGDPWDAVADLGGVVLGVTLAVVGRRRRRW
jgi:hypothetical protein